VSSTYRLVLAMYDPDTHHRRSVRLTGYDYAQSGAYFVTICSHRNREVFGCVRGETVQHNAYGQIVGDCWTEIPQHFPHVELDGWIVMPNHLHGILLVTTDTFASGVLPQFGTSKRGSVAIIINRFKGAVTRRVTALRREQNRAPVIVWQKSFHDRVIRDARELEIKRRYIAENPIRWGAGMRNLM
jgi:REP element-mobilizing transposase RayT